MTCPQKPAVFWGLGPKGQEGGLDGAGRVRAAWCRLGACFAQLEAFPGCGE